MSAALGQIEQAFAVFVLFVARLRGGAALVRIATQLAAQLVPQLAPVRAGGGVDPLQATHFSARQGAVQQSFVATCERPRGDTLA